MTVEWRILPSNPDYAVSSIGAVLRVEPDQCGRLSGKPLKQTIDRDGYAMVTPRRDGVGNPRHVHRLVCEAFHGPAPTNAHQAAHGDGIRLNNTPDNLRWATPVENQRDREMHGTDAKGSRNHFASLTEQQVIAIRADPRSQSAIAADHGITQAAVSKIKRRATWAHLQGE